MSDNVFRADNQQGSSRRGTKNPSETTRRSPFIPAMNKREIYAYVHGAMHDASLNKGCRVRFGQKYPEWLELIQSLLRFVGVHSWMYKEGKDRNLFILETVCRGLDFAFDPVTLTTKGERVAYIRGFLMQRVESRAMAANSTFSLYKKISGKWKPSGTFLPVLEFTVE